MVSFLRRQICESAFCPLRCERTSCKASTETPSCSNAEPLPVRKQPMTPETTPPRHQPTDRTSRFPRRHRRHPLPVPVHYLLHQLLRQAQPTIQIRSASILHQQWDRCSTPRRIRCPSVQMLGHSHRAILVSRLFEQSMRGCIMLDDRLEATSRRISGQGRSTLR